MKWPSWRVVSVLAGVLVCVLAVHLAVLVWWQQARSVSGDGVWTASAAHPFRVRATVLQEVVPQAPKTAMGEAREVAPIPLRSTADLIRETSAPLAAPAQLGAPAPSGQKQPWVPLPSDYLAVEQVDAFPHPQDDWQLDWSQVPMTQTAWRITLRIWVSAAGQIDHVEILDAEPQGDWVSRLLGPLARTDLVPAQLAGQAVPVTYVVQLAPDQLP